MGKSIYTDEMLCFIKEQIANQLRGREIARLFSEHFNMDFSERKLIDLCHRNNIKIGKKKPRYDNRVLTDEQVEYLKTMDKKYSVAEIQQKMNEKFNLNLTTRQITHQKTKNKVFAKDNGRFKKGNIPKNKFKKGVIISPQYMFKKGNIPKNVYPQGHEYVDYHGDVRVKKIEIVNGVKIHKRVLKKNEIWESYHGKIPKGYTVIFIDRNKQNLDISNLILVNKQELVRLNNLFKLSDDTQLNKAKILLAKLIAKQHEKQREIINARNKEF